MRDDMSEKDNLLEDSYFKDVAKEIYKHPGLGHDVLVVQPRLKTGPKRDKKDRAEMKLAEAVALVKTLPGWKVIQKVIVPVQGTDSKLIFGRGNLDKLKVILQQSSNISAVFIGLDILTARQNVTLEDYFGVQVFDRYQVILQIFHDHAHSRDAKLQLALAEIPYLRVKLCGFSHTYDSSTFTGISRVGGDGETHMDTRRRLLNERELKLKKALEKIAKQRHMLRQNDKRNSLPIVAVVGYTNCGKTTLIKSLTNDARLQPEDKLFATVDVTLHAGMLPSTQKVLYIDTVGFISDVPTALVRSFKATLEEISLADLVIHVRDISHPDTETQKKVVLDTLNELNLPQSLISTIIEVGNKSDLLENLDDIKKDDMMLISASRGDGLPDLVETIEENVLLNMEYSVTLLRIPNGGTEYSWLMKEAAIRDAIADMQDSNYLKNKKVLMK